MNHDFVIRPAQPYEIEVLCDFQLSMAWESEGLRLDRSVLKRGLEEFMRRPNEGIYYGINADGNLIGCCMVQHEWSEWRAKRVLWLHSVFILPAYRRLGGFRALYAFLQARVKAEPELAGIRLYVDKGNTKAQAAYRNIGMTDEHYKLFEWLAPDH